MEFLILGPLEVRADGRSLAVSGPKQRALLAILLLHANEVVSTDRLIDELWGDSPPDTGNAALQMRVSALRKVLQKHGQRLVTRNPGYLLLVESDELDAERFERLLGTGRNAMRAGDAEAASDSFHQALSLWRGDPLADFAYEPFAQAEIARLGELRTTAVEERIEADLELGRHADVIGELEAHVAAHPLRERACGLLMLALYRSGRQVEALAVFHATRRTLVDDLGLEPGAALQLLERQILLQDSALDKPKGGLPGPAPDVTWPLPERRKTVTVAVTQFLERVGRSEIDPERLRQIGARCVAAASLVYEQHGGVIESSFGSKLVAIFGNPVLHEDDALRAVRSASRVAAVLSTLGDELDRDFGVRIAARTGVATGEVVTSGSALGRPSVVGEPMILASHLQQQADSGQILLAESTRQMTKDAVRVELVELVDAASAWRLVGIGQSEPIGAPAGARLVGRANELAQLRIAFERATRDRTLHLCTVLGGAGIGKSRLAQEFLSEITGQATAVIGRCLAYGEGITFWPLREIVQQLAPGGGISELLAGAHDADLVARRVSGAVGLSETIASVEETFWATRRLFETVARKRPLVVVVEDIHWAEPTLLAMLDYVALRTHDAPILLLCLARPELLAERPSFGAGTANVTSILLEPLADHDSQALMDDRLGPMRLETAMRARIHETAEGNPLFIEQMVAMAVAQGMPGGDLPIPPTIQALLAARIERLGPGERGVLERAAVVGREFTLRAVTDLLPKEAQPTVGRHIDALVAKDLLRSDTAIAAVDEGFRFRHVLIQQSAYRSIPKQLRAETHEAFADWLETTRREDALDVDDVVGYHLEQAFRYRAELAPGTERERDLAGRAGKRLASAGRRAFTAGDMPAAVKLLERAATLLPSGDPERLRSLCDLGVALFDIGALDRAGAILDEATDLGRVGGDVAVEWGSRVKRIHVEMSGHPEGISGEGLFPQVAEAIEILRGLGDDGGLTRAWITMADVQWAKGKSVLAASAARRSVRHARRVRSRREESWAFGSYSYFLLFGSTPAAVAIRRLKQHLHNAEGAPVIASNLAGFLAAHEAMTGLIPEARERIAPSRTLVRDLGLTWQTGTHDILSAFIESLAGDQAAAERDLRSAYQTFSQMRDRWFLSIVTVNLAKVILEQGRPEEAWDMLAGIGETVGDPDLWIRTPALRARLLASRGLFGEAETLARLAVAQAETTDFLGFHGDAYFALAEVLRLDGRTDGAIDALGSAIQLYERKGNVVEARRARAQQLTLSNLTRSPTT